MTRNFVLSMDAMGGAGFAFAGIAALACLVDAAEGVLVMPEQPLSKMAVSSKPQRTHPWLRCLITDLHGHGGELQGNELAEGAVNIAQVRHRANKNTVNGFAVDVDFLNVGNDTA